MKYSEMVMSTEAFAAVGLQKAALDIAQLLDSDLLPVDAQEAYYRENQAKQRGEVFADFCALCHQAGVPIPDLEPKLYCGLITIPSEEQRQKFAALKAQVFKRLRHQTGREASEARALVNAIGVLGAYVGNSYMGIKLDNFMGALNVRLACLNLEPLREDYSQRQAKVRISEAGPLQELTVVIVDDSADDLVKTARALAGWPNLKVLLYHQRLEGKSYSISPKKKQDEKEKAAKEILDLNPNIILMDMGLQGFEGTDLIKQIRTVSDPLNIVFIANTGGSEDELRMAGALANCDKGRNFQGVREAIRSL